MSPIRTLCATTSLFLLALATACTPQSPTERVAEMRSRFTVEVEPGTVGEVLGSLDAAHPGFADRLLDEDG